MAAVMTGLPSLNHEMVGIGSPSALHPKVTGSFLATAVSSGCSMILGAEEAEAGVPKTRVFYFKSLYETRNSVRPKVQWSDFKIFQSALKIR